MGGDTKMAARVPVEPCAGKSGHLSGGRRLAGSATKLRVWKGPIRDPKVISKIAALAVVVPAISLAPLEKKIKTRFLVLFFRRRPSVRGFGSEETEFIRGLDAEVHPVRFCDIGGFLMRGHPLLSRAEGGSKSAEVEGPPLMC